MKKIIFNFVLISMYSFLKAQNVNDKVKVEHSGTWYEATVLKVNSKEGKFYIKYQDWDEVWNEWVGPDRIKVTEPSKAPALSKFKVGDRVEVEYGMIPEPAVIIEVGENKYHIKYDKTVFGDKWVTEKQIKKL